MSNKSGAIGTWTAQEVVKYLCVHGFPGAERTALHGALDEGDITGCGPDLCFEVKGGAAAEHASDAQITAWLLEAEHERVNRGAAHAVLVLKRKGKGAANVGQWWAILSGHSYVHIATAGVVWEYERLCPVRLLLADAVSMLRHAGFGSQPYREVA